MTWIAPEPPDDPPFPDTSEIRPILQGYLDHHRLTLLRICAGLTAEQLALRPVPPSSLSLLGLVRHMTKVERTWLRVRAAGEEIAPLFPATDEDFDDLDPASAEQAVTALQAEWAACDAAVAPLPLEHCLDVRGQQVSLASFYIHLVEEWARHNGHADLIRQAIDGTTGR
ncbi:MAG: DinB family protein [Acidimicrobiales bacterium]